MRLKPTFLAGILAALWLGAAGGATQAQQMLLLSSRTSGLINEPATFDIFVTGNVGGAVAWGTTVALLDPVHMSFVPNYQGSNNPYLSEESFFDLDLTDTSQAGLGILKFNFLNATPGANLGNNGPVTLVEFQVLFDSQTPLNTDLTIGLSALDDPPDGTAVQDDQGNNLLLPLDPNNPTGPGSTVHFYVTEAGWNVGSPPPPEVPEPSAWLFVAASVLSSAGVLYRRRCRHDKSCPYGLIG